jgi:hypothetical protein
MGGLVFSIFFLLVGEKWWVCVLRERFFGCGAFLRYPEYLVATYCLWTCFIMKRSIQILCKSPWS